MQTRETICNNSVFTGNDTFEIKPNITRYVRDVLCIDKIDDRHTVFICKYDSIKGLIWSRMYRCEISEAEYNHLKGIFISVKK